MTQEELLKKAKSNLPRTYLDAVSEIGLSGRINTIGKQCNLSEKQTDILDQEVVYLILHITDPADFTERLAEGMEVNDDTLLEIVNKVTAGILRPLQNILNDQAGEEETENQQLALDIPVPPPPSGSGNTPSPSYGGTSDPYREPVDD